MSRARNPATRSRFRSENLSHRVSDGRPTSQVSAFWPTSFPIPHCTFGPTILRRWRPRFMAPKGRAPLKAFAGEVGLAPAEPGQHSVVPPRAVGGNLDIRDLAEGTTLYLPVEVEGGLFSIGDKHAAQC